MPTLLQYRQQVAKELGAFTSSTVTSGTTALLTDTSSALTSTTKSTNFYKDWYLFRPNGWVSDRVRRVATYTPSSGSLTPDAAWAFAPAVGEVYELHGFIEPLTDMTDIINEALKRCFVTAEETITPVPLATRHSLSLPAVVNWMAITAPWQVRAVGVLSSGEVRSQTDPYQRVVRGQVVRDNVTWYIDHPGYTFNATDTLYLQLALPAYNVCATGAGAIQIGMSSETDTALPSLEWLAPGALVEAFSRFSNILDPTSSQRMQADRLEYASRFTRQCQMSFQLPLLRFRPIVPMGPLPTGSYPGYY